MYKIYINKSKNLNALNIEIVLKTYKRNNMLYRFNDNIFKISNNNLKQSKS